MYLQFRNLASHLRSPVLLLMRLAWGIESAQAGWGHLHDIAGTTKNFEGWGVPMAHFNVYVAGSTELVGGILLILGLATRLVSLPLVFNFIVAIIAAGRGRIWNALTADNGFHPLDGFTSIVDDTAFPFEILALVTLAFGAGKLSLDYLIGRFAFGIKDAPG